MAAPPPRRSADRRLHPNRGRRRGRAALWAAVGATLLLILIGLQRANDNTTIASGASQPAREAQGPYRMASTRGCLEARGAAVDDVRPTDWRLQAFRDLAQHTSMQVQLNGQLVAAAFVPSEPDARLLADILVVPDDPYRIATYGNVVVLYPASAQRAHGDVAACLRP